MLLPDGRVIMISAANRGIGYEFSKRLYEQGYTLSLGARDEAKLVLAASNFDADRLLTHRFEAQDISTSEAWVKATVERFGRIDGLLNVVGISTPFAITDEDEADLDMMFEINVKAPLRLIRLTLPYLKKSGSGRIINVCSASGKRVSTDYVGYHMTKFATVALSHAARRIAWDEGVRAVAFCPGVTNTEMSMGKGKGPTDQMTQPEDLADLAATLIALPNNASVAEIIVNRRLEDML
jgi:NADP-dependent 3-hydroxy acid dehydrogenase YdfG